MRAWPFGKSKTPGFGISKGFYYSVLASKATLPSVVEVINPKGEGGAVQGFGAPLAASATKDDLNRPLQRGAYAIATSDRKTVLRLVVVSKEEAGFDPEAFLRSSHAASIPAEMAARIRGTWNLLQLTFEAHDPMVYTSLDFFELVAVKLAQLGEGVIADALSQRYLLPHELILPTRSDPRVDAREHVAVTVLSDREGIQAHTMGMQKFGLPEFEIFGVHDSLFREVESVLLGLAQAILLGRRISAGDTVGTKDGMLEVREGGLDRRRWEGIPVLELIPVRGGDVSAAIRAMATG